MTTVPLDKQTARRIVNQLGGSGQPPIYGVQYFSSGLDKYLKVLEYEYLEDYINDGGSAFKLVVGVYGGGKTHFLYNVRDLALKQGFAISYVSLSSGECPFHKLELVYKAIIDGLLPPVPLHQMDSEPETGISPFLCSWYYGKREDYQQKGLSEQEIDSQIHQEIREISARSVSFSHAIKEAILSLKTKRRDDFDLICQWLKLEGFDKKKLEKFQILQKIDKSTAFQMIASLSQTVRHLGYSGLVVLLDEAEQVPSLSSKSKEQHLSNLREIIDKCGSSTELPGVMFLYAVPTANFLEGKTGVYVALKDRIKTFFSGLNPTGVQIDLEKSVSEPVEFLAEVGQKLVKVYEAAYECTLPRTECDQLIDTIAEWSIEKKFIDAGYKRLFVQKLVLGFRILHQDERLITSQELDG